PGRCGHRRDAVAGGVLRVDRLLPAVVDAGQPVVEVVGEVDVTPVTTPGACLDLVAVGIVAVGDGNAGIPCDPEQLVGRVVVVSLGVAFLVGAGAGRRPGQPVADQVVGEGQPLPGPPVLLVVVLPAARGLEAHRGQTVGRIVGEAIGPAAATLRAVEPGR